MTYKETKILCQLAKNKGNTSFIEENDLDVPDICFKSIFIWVVTYIFVNFMIIFTTGKETATISESYGYLMPLLSFITTTYFVLYSLKIEKKTNKRIIEENEKLLTKVNKKFLKNKSKENVYESINNLFILLIKKGIVKDNEKDFKLSDKKFKKLLSIQLKYDKNLKLIEKDYIRKILKKN